MKSAILAMLDGAPSARVAPDARRRCARRPSSMATARSTQSL